MMRAAAVWVMLAAGFAPSAHGQSNLVLRANQRVRIRLPNPPPLIGRLQFIDRFGVTIRTRRGSQQITVPRHIIRTIEVSRGVDPRLRFGAPLLGAVAGALIGPALTDEPGRCRLSDVHDDECNPVLPDGVVGAAWGAVGVTLLTRFIASERWTAVILEPIARADRATRTVSLGVALSF